MRRNDDNAQDFRCETLEESTESLVLHEFPNDSHTSNFGFEVLVLDSSLDDV